MKKRMIAALFCAGLLAMAPISGIPATLPGGGGGYRFNRKCGG